MPMPDNKGKYLIDISSEIGYWGTSKQEVQRKLNANADQEVAVRINSLGGSLDHGLDIMNRFREHGKVTAYLYGMNASSATIASLGAKKIYMDEHGLYLIHQVSNWVGLFGYMNAEQLSDAIKQLQDNKDENDKIDQVLVEIYSSKSNLDEKQLKKLLKKGGWITAKQALEMGFVDELIPSAGEGKQNYAGINDKLNSLNLPTLTAENFAVAAPDFLETANELPGNKLEALLNRFESRISNLFNSKTKPTQMEKLNTLTHVNAVLEVEELDLKEGKLNISEEELTKINSKLEEQEKTKKELEAEKKAQAKKIKELEAKVTLLENSAGDKTVDVDDADDIPADSKKAKTAKDLLNEIKDL